MPTDDSTAHLLLRQRDGHHARVTNEELFFDLVYVFAVTQISHGLLHHLTPLGALQTAVLWFAAWLGWQYTGWVTNWLDPRVPAVRGLLFATMVLALLAGAAAPEAYSARGLVFALCYAGMQTGRSAFIVAKLPATHALSPNFRRILGWVSIAAIFWVAGGLAPAPWRLTLWIVAVLCEYVSPMFGFPLPGLGRSHTRDWTIDGAHLVERCQLFVIVALGETILASGTSLAESGNWNLPELTAFGTGFLGTLAMWGLYFGTSGERAEHAITHSDDPGRIGARFHYIHAVLIGGIIVTAVGTDLMMENPVEEAAGMVAALMVTGPILYVLASAAYRYAATGCSFPRLPLLATVVLLFLGMEGHLLSRLELGLSCVAVLLLLSWNEKRAPSHSLF